MGTWIVGFIVVAIVAVTFSIASQDNKNGIVCSGCAGCSGCGEAVEHCIEKKDEP